ncbi:hypothetical protein H2200_005989 [Cladophialophora chaetospira]|uniref:Pisatin demethylase n=1 Tax=Cladophialophora chaetospira TaxID=386627 RepID=A0AA39CIM7_9EURO|nr:hypothetical protein H2200_005989 [Cladophialophora chaetospira]
MAVLEHLHIFAQTYFAILLLVLLVGRLLVNKYGRGLNSIPGPFLAGFTNLWRVFDTAFSNPTNNLILLHRKLSSNFVRIGPRVVSVADPSLIQTIYGVGTKFRKTEFYSIIDVWHEGKLTQSLFECRDEDYHARIRRPIANAYSMSTLVEFEPAVDSTVDLLSSRLDRFVASGEPCPLNQWLRFYSFDVLGEILFSKKMGFLEAGSDLESVMLGIRLFTKYWQAVGQIPMLDQFLLHNPLMKRYGPDVPMMSFTLSRLKDRLAWKASGHPTQHDFLERCIEAQAKFPDVVTDRLIVLYLFDNIGGGADTAAVTLTSIMYYLLKNPKSLQLVVSEIDNADKEGHLSDPVTWKEARELTYFQACVKEALRMHPPIGLMLERYVPKGGITMGGHFFPEGTIVGVNAWVTARNQAIYGPDADTFRPERWLEASKDQLSAMERANFAVCFLPAIK